MISIYKNVYDTKSKDSIEIDTFLDHIKTGYFQDDVINFKTAKTKDEQDKAKRMAHVVTISGLFNDKNDTGLITHSGFICIDIDNVDPMETKSILCSDNFVYAAFESISGHGLAVIFKIDGKRHKEAFSAISEHLATNYGLVSDPSCINVSRGRFVSHDPHIYINHDAKRWVQYQEKTDKIKPHKTIYVKTDFDEIIKNIDKRGIDIAGCYQNWLKIGFAFANKFGDAGREYFHIISKHRNGAQAANEKLINRQYDACLKSERGNRSGVTIDTFYYFVKQAGIETYSTETKEIIKLAASQKRAAGMGNDAIIKNMKEFTEFDHDAIDEAVPQVEKDTFVEDQSIIDIVKDEVKLIYQIRRNVITRQLEINDNGHWKNVDDIYLNTMYLNLKRHITKLSADLFDKIVFSKFTDEFNPFLDFINRHKELTPYGNIRKLSDCIKSDFGLSGDDREYFIRKWLVGMISSIHGEHSPLMLVLTGEKQGTGKTQFFRRLLPDELRNYHADSKLDMEKDAEILMTKKLIILDDELAGKSKRENTRLKELTSKQTFSVREPYGRVSVDLNRIAVLAGTSNENGILSDPTGNRRVIPIHVSAIDHDKYNSINKTYLFMEAYNCWKTGVTHEFSFEDIDRLKKYTDREFDEVSVEEESIFQHFKIPGNDYEGDYFTSTHIASHIDIMSRIKLTPKRIGMYMIKNNVKKESFRLNGSWAFGYRLIKSVDNGYNDTPYNGNAPF